MVRLLFRITVGRVAVGRLTAGLAVALFALAAGPGCTREADRVEMSRVPPPEGGSLFAVATIEEDDATRLAAPGRSRLHVRSDADSRWEDRRVRWPDVGRTSGRSPLEGLGRPEEQSNFPSGHRFAALGDRFWMLSRPGSDEPPVLLSTDARGETWSRVDLPASAKRTGTSPSRRSPTPSEAQLAQVDPSTPLRIVARRGALYLFASDAVWRARPEQEGLSDWSKLSTLGVSQLESRGRRSLPAVVRNYLPATDARPFELLTVYGSRLFVYRRHRKSDRWMVVDTLPTIDRELEATSAGEPLYLLAPDTLYRSRELGERWQRLEPTAALDSRPEVAAMALVESDGGPPNVLVGTESGAVVRSENGGNSWTVRHPPDPDGRDITDFAVGPEGRRIWAATRGSGILASVDAGRNWEHANRGLRATRPLDLEIGLNGELLTGTDAGLHRLTGAPADGHWDGYHTRATTAIGVDETQSTLLSGTLGGAVVRGGEDHRRAFSGPKPSADSPLLFKPWRMPELLDRDSAILDFDFPPNERVVAWTRGLGRLVSPDGGDQWERPRLNEGLERALLDSVVTDSLVDRTNTSFLATRELGRRGAPRIWRSPVDTDAWSSVTTLHSSRRLRRLLLRRSADARAGELFYAYGGELARTTEGGNHWTALDGPWNEGTIRALALTPEHRTLVFRTPKSHRVSIIDRIDRDPPVQRTYDIDWTDPRGGPGGNVHDVIRYNQFVVVAAGANLYAGAIPRGRSQLPHAPTIIATLVVITLLTGLSFWYLRYARLRAIRRD